MTADHSGTCNLKICFVPNILEVTVHMSIAKISKTKSYFTQVWILQLKSHLQNVVTLSQI
jgi:hypothetical protein